MEREIPHPAAAKMPKEAAKIVKKAEIGGNYEGEIVKKQGRTHK